MKLKIAWYQIRRTPYQTLAAVMIIFLTFFAISVFTLISLGLLQILQHFEKSPQVIGFFEKGKDLTTEQQANIRSKLESTGKLDSFKYVSTREAEAIYREKNKNDPLLLELVNYKILPPSIEISASRIEFLPELKSILEKAEAIEELVYYEDIVISLSSWIRNIRLFGIGLISFLLFQSVLVISTITAMKIMHRKEEIEIMRLIGASYGFVVWPFIFEGVFYGLFGAFLAWGTAYLVLLYSTPLLLSWLEDIQLLPVPFYVMLIILGAELVAGALVGMFSSLFSVMRFLRRS